MRGTRRFSLLLLLLRLRPNRMWSSLRRVHPTEESSAPLVVILRTNLSQFTVSTLVCHHRPLRGMRHNTMLTLRHLHSALRLRPLLSTRLRPPPTFSAPDVHCSAEFQTQVDAAVQQALRALGISSLTPATTAPPQPRRDLIDLSKLTPYQAAEQCSSLSFLTSRAWYGVNPPAGRRRDVYMGLLPNLSPGRTSSTSTLRSARSSRSS